MPTTLAKPSVQVDSTLGKFVLRELLGEGGMGQVYRAEDSLLHRNVAIKVLKPEFSQSDDFQQRFLREARLAASIEHDCIVPIYDLGQDRGVWYLAMQLLQGETLHAYLKREKVPALAVTMSVFAQVLRGLAVAHGKGLIHRDVKPSNLWLEPMERDGKFRCKILDFGLACSDSTEGYTTATGTGTFGTVFYMPFEQLNQEKVDHRADIYSLGVVLYEMLTGQLPYRSPSPVAQAFEMWEGPPKPPHEVNSKVPRAISELNLKMLLHTRETRVGSAVEVLKELETIITNPEGKPLIQGTLPEFVLFPERGLEISLKSTSRGANSDQATKPDQGTKPDQESTPDAGPPPVAPPEKHGASLPAADTDLEAWTMHPQAPTVMFVSKITDEECARALKKADPSKFLPPRESAQTPSESPEPFAEPAAEVVAPAPKRSRRKVPFAVVAILLGVLVVGVRSFLKAPQPAPGAKGNPPAVAEHPREEHPPVVARHEPTKPIVARPAKSNLPAPAPLDCTGPNGASEEQIRSARKAWAAYLGVAEETTVELGNGASMKFVLVPPGKFLMGSSKSDIAAALRADPALELKRTEREEPQHVVVLTRPFFLGAFEVTREEFAALGGAVKPGREGDEPRLPADRVSWNEASGFCEKLSQLSLPAGFSKAALPTEAQWEYACRAGTKTPFFFGGELNGKEANCNSTTPFGTKTKGAFRERAVSVGQFAPNRFGMHDMHGNLAEWCLDPWAEFSYRVDGRTDPLLSGGGRDRVIRGGSWDDYPRFCRSAWRNWTDEESKTDYIGFRVALVP